MITVSDGKDGVHQQQDDEMPSTLVLIHCEIILFCFRGRASLFFCADLRSSLEVVVTVDLIQRVLALPHNAVKLLFVDDAVAVPVRLVDHFLQLLVCQVFACKPQRGTASVGDEEG